jgi:hypothetical protein
VPPTICQAVRQQAVLPTTHLSDRRASERASSSDAPKTLKRTLFRSSVTCTAFCCSRRATAGRIPVGTSKTQKTGPAECRDRHALAQIASRTLAAAASKGLAPGSSHDKETQAVMVVCTATGPAQLQARALLGMQCVVDFSPLGGAEHATSMCTQRLVRHP